MESSGSPASVVGRSSNVGGSLPTRSRALSQCFTAAVSFTPTRVPPQPTLWACLGSPMSCRSHGRRCPVGHPAPLRTIFDVAVPQYDEVWAAGPTDPNSQATNKQIVDAMSVQGCQYAIRIEGGVRRNVMGVSTGRISQIKHGDLSCLDVLDRYVQALGRQLELVATFGDEQRHR